MVYEMEFIASQTVACIGHPGELVPKHISVQRLEKRRFCICCWITSPLGVAMFYKTRLF
jgi:hypothetical protein